MRSGTREHDFRVEKLSACCTGAVNHPLRDMESNDHALPHRIAPLQPEMTIAGSVFTVDGRPGEAADPNATLLDWTGPFSRARLGWAWCAQPLTEQTAQPGELSAETLNRKGVLGCVIDGAKHGSDLKSRLGFPCWLTNHAPRDIAGARRPAGVDV